MGGHGGKLNTGTVVDQNRDRGEGRTLQTGESVDRYFAYGSYAKSYSPEQFAKDSALVDLYRGIDFERSSQSYEEGARQRGYFQARKRWEKQIQYFRRNGG